MYYLIGSDASTSYSYYRRETTRIPEKDAFRFGGTLSQTMFTLSEYYRRRIQCQNTNYCSSPLPPYGNTKWWTQLGVSNICSLIVFMKVRYVRFGRLKLHLLRSWCCNSRFGSWLKNAVNINRDSSTKPTLWHLLWRSLEHDGTGADFESHPEHEV